LVNIIGQIGNHSFRATGITAYLANGATLEHAQEMAAHEARARQNSMTVQRNVSRKTRSREFGYNLPIGLAAARCE
jgi:hypothetical protein